MQYKFADLVDLNQWQELMDNFYKLTGIQHSLVEMDGSFLSSAGWQDICKQFHMVNDAGIKRCLQSRLELVDLADNAQPYVLTECHNGLKHAGAPVIVAGECVALLALGQFFTETPDLAYFRRQAAKLGVDAEQYLDAVARVPVLKMQDIDACMRYYVCLAQLLSQAGLNRIKQREAEKRITAVNKELQQRVEERTNQLAQVNSKLQLDIYEKQRVLWALQESEERYRILYEYSPNGIIVHDGERIIFANNAAVKILGGKNKDDLQGRLLKTLYSSAYIGAVKKRYQDALEGNGVGERVEENILRLDGSEINVMLRYLAFNYDGQALIMAVFDDNTEYKKMLEELVKSTKLESIGILAGGIAHDFNNILMIISGNLSLARMYVEPESVVYRKLAGVEKAVEQATGLTQQLLTFAKGGAPVKKTLLIDDLIKETVSFALSGSHVRCDFSLEPALWAVRIDEGQIRQVLNNIVINAVQAMEHGGIVHVSTKNLVVKDDSSLMLRAGNYIGILISDEGTGIPAEDKVKIFDPYFTTKQKGSGLGLATAYAIVKKHDGEITCETELGKGSAFRIYLPALAHKNTVNRQKTEKIYNGKGKILVMDDDPQIRQVMGEMLTLLNYEISHAKDGAEAIRQYTDARAQGQPFDAVIMDLTIPGGMGGKETIAKLREIDPHVKAIVSSGYYNDPVMANFRQYGFSGFVEKPFKIEEMSRILNKVLREATG